VEGAGDGGDDAYLVLIASLFLFISVFAHADVLNIDGLAFALDRLRRRESGVSLVSHCCEACLECAVGCLIDRVDGGDEWVRKVWERMEKRSAGEGRRRLVELS
jgi:hypothetical protein